MLPELIMPQLDTKVVAPLNLLEQAFITHCREIEDWFSEQWRKYVPPVYGSVDLRNAGFKIAPIDMNLFPAGFNNLNPSFFNISIAAAKKIIDRVMPTAKKILIVPESHTRNLLYWENVKTLQSILQSAGYEVKLASISDDIQETTIIKLSDNELLLEKLQREEDHLNVVNFTPDVILLNNDLSAGIPPILQNVQQKIIPPAELGWSQRLKSGHFQYYAQVAKEFAELLAVDPWLIDPLFKHCGKIDFLQQEGMVCLETNTQELFDEIQAKYAQYQIPYDPFIIVKADAGTYGMAVMTVRHPDELKNLNRKQRTRMAATKGGQPVRRVIIQEGVYSFESFGIDRAVAEPVVYLWGEDVVGGFYRVHKARGNDENLNAPGMHFAPIAFTETCNTPCQRQDTGQNRFYVYGMIAKLSMLAAAREIHEQVK